MDLPVKEEKKTERVKQALSSKYKQQRYSTRNTLYMMELLTLELFIPMLEPYANKELLTPAESLQLTLLITELLVDNYVDFRLLKFLSRYFTQQSYDDVVEERNIEHECGYVLCNKQPKLLVRRLSSHSNGTTPASMHDTGVSTHYQISNRKPSIILPNTYLSQYCCKEHYQASIFYKNQLSNEALFARKNIMVTAPFEGRGNYYENGITCLEEVIAKHRELKPEGKSMAEVIVMMNGLSVGEQDTSEETNRLIKMIEDFEIVEKDGDEDVEAAAEAESEKELHKANGRFNNQFSQSFKSNGRAPVLNDKLFKAIDGYGTGADDDDDDDDDDGTGADGGNGDGDDQDEEGNNKFLYRNIEGYVTSNKSFGGYVV